MLPTQLCSGGSAESWESTKSRFGGDCAIQCYCRWLANGAHGSPDTQKPVLVEQSYACPSCWRLHGMTHGSLCFVATPSLSRGVLALRRWRSPGIADWLSQCLGGRDIPHGQPDCGQSDRVLRGLSSLLDAAASVSFACGCTADGATGPVTSDWQNQTDGHLTCATLSCNTHWWPCLRIPVHFLVWHTLHAYGLALVISYIIPRSSISPLPPI